MLIESTLTSKKAREAIMIEALNEIDTDGSGMINQQEWLHAVRDERVWACMKALGVDANEYLFFVLDRDGDNDITIDEFVEGLTHLRGQASAIDVYHVIKKLDKLVFLLE